MKYIFILITLLLLGFISKAQDSSLPNEVCKIYPYTGRNIVNVKLWHIDSLKIEYVTDGNLADIKTMEVKRIESLNYRIEFDENQKMVTKMYDLIITTTGDTLRGMIKKLAGYNVTYIPAGKDNTNKVTREFKNYILNNPTSGIEKEDIKMVYQDDETPKTTAAKTTSVEGTTKPKPKENKDWHQELKTCCTVVSLFAGISILINFF